LLFEVYGRFLNIKIVIAKTIAIATIIATAERRYISVENFYGVMRVNQR
jgi:hypothetical protein